MNKCNVYVFIIYLESLYLVLEFMWNSDHILGYIYVETDTSLNESITSLVMFFCWGLCSCVTSLLRSFSTAYCKLVASTVLNWCLLRLLQESDSVFVSLCISFLWPAERLEGTRNVKSLHKPTVCGLVMTWFVQLYATEIDSMSPSNTSFQFSISCCHGKHSSRALKLRNCSHKIS